MKTSPLFLWTFALDAEMPSVGWRMNRVSIKGLIFAVLATLLLDLTFSFVLMLAGRPHGQTDEELEASILAITSSNQFLLASLVLGTLTTVMGGYVAGRYGSEAPLLNAFLFGLFGITTGYLMGMEGYPLWFIIPGLLGTLPASLLGGYAASCKTRGDGIDSVVLLGALFLLTAAPVLLYLLLAGPGAA